MSSAMIETTTSSSTKVNPDEAHCLRLRAIMMDSVKPTFLPGGPDARSPESDLLKLPARGAEFKVSRFDRAQITRISE